MALGGLKWQYIAIIATFSSSVFNACRSDKWIDSRKTFGIADWKMIWNFCNIASYTFVLSQHVEQYFVHAFGMKQQLRSV